jgi:hypothetical protein
LRGCGGLKQDDSRCSVRQLTRDRSSAEPFSTTAASGSHPHPHPHIGARPHSGADMGDLFPTSLGVFDGTKASDLQVREGGKEREREREREREGERERERERETARTRTHTLSLTQVTVELNNPNIPEEELHKLQRFMEELQSLAVDTSTVGVMTS